MAEFRLHGSRLIVRGDLDEDAEVEMRCGCRELLDRDAETLTVDLSRAGRTASTCIGALVAFWIDLREAGRRGKIVPSPSVMHELEVTGLAGVLLRPMAGGASRDEDSKGDGAKRAKF